MRKLSEVIQCMMTVEVFFSNYRTFIFKFFSMKKAETYRLVLLQGDYFHAEPQQFLESLFRHFSLLSWLSSASEVRIHNKDKLYADGKPRLHPDGTEATLYTFTTKVITRPAFLVEFRKDPKEKTISYCSFDDRQTATKAVTSKSLKQTIGVVMSMHQETSKLDSSKKRSVIFIDITDQEGFFKCGVKKLEERLSEKKDRCGPNVIHYPYRQPLSRRNKETPECHFNLAFQGGGAKGVSYVGVYKALKELHSGIPISSVIGSSAGGILALAISSGMSPGDISHLCLQMDQIPKDKYFTSEKQITPKIQAEFDGIIKKLKSLLHNYGIMETSVFDQITDTLEDIETQSKILKVLQAINPSIAELFSIQLAHPFEISRGFFTKPEIVTHRFNYYGLLMAGMMKGNAVENIAASCLVNFIEKHFDPTHLQEYPQHRERVPVIMEVLKRWGFSEAKEELFESPEFKEKVKLLTLREYYAMTGVEFTCTSVDLDDQTLRFFNHKTTPDLPVCKTVQMTGSFPVAFEAQKWRRQWGKYYIHYNSFRKEIDLTGHEFTDGGLLANFPIKYLDNEHMRPMYFSHKQNAQRTILYGFGLDPVADPNDNQKEKTRAKEQAIADLKEHLNSKFSKLRLLKSLIFSDSTWQMPQTELDEVPVLRYAIKLLRTLTVADYNLNRECFSKSIVEMEVEERVLEESKLIWGEIERYESFDQSLENLEKISRSKQQALPHEVLSATCERLLQKLTDFQNTENSVLKEIKEQALDSLYNYEGGRIRNRFAESREITAFIRTLQGLSPQDIFKMQVCINIKTQLIDTLKQIQQYFQGLKGTPLGQLTIIYEGIINTQLETIGRVRERLADIIQNLRAVTTPRIGSKEYSEMTFIDYQLVFDLISMEKKFFIADQDYLKETMKEIKELHLPVISVDKEILDNARRIQYELNDILSNGSSPKLHLVFQSKENSLLYYCGLYSLLQEVLNHSNNQDRKIEMITCADFHAVFAFLLAGGKKINNIRKEMWRVKDLITLEQGIEKEYNSFKWAQTYSQEMNQLLELTWKDQYKLFDQVEQYLSDTRQHQLREQLRQMRIEYVYSKDAVGKAMEQVLAYVLESAREAEKIQDPGLRKKKLAQLLSLQNGKRGKDYMSKNKIISKNTQRLINKLMFHFQELITYIILNNHLIADAFSQFSPNQRQIVWKGVLVKRLLSSKKLELYLKEKLEDMKLNANTSLSEFYEFSPRKITLNFVLVNKREQRLEIVNRFTRPNMPLWAAIIASASMPYILPEFASNEEWEFSPFSDSRMRKLVNYFFSSEERSIQTFYVAGNFVSTLPLEFLTNEKIARQNYAIKDNQEIVAKAVLLATSNGLKPPAGNSHPAQFNSSTQLSYPNTTSSSFQGDTAGTDYTCITFSFRKRETGVHHYKYQASDKHFLTFSNLLNLGLDYVLGRFKNIEVGFKDILRRVEILKLLETRIQCHDNTIMYYYKDQTLKLPIRLGTLDFYKIQRDRPETLNSCIYEAEFVVRGIFENLHVGQDKQCFHYRAKKETYLQFRTEEDKIYIQFPSKSKWNKKLATMYRIFYRSDPEEELQQYQDDEPIVLPNNVTSIQLKFVFPNMNTMRLQEQVMEVDFYKLTENQQNQQNLIFRFNYETPEKKFLKGITLDRNKLQTKILPPAHSTKLLITDHGELSGTQLVRISSAKKRENRWNGQEGGRKILMIQPIVSFKHNGLLCKCCTHHLKRSSLKDNEITAGKCGKCYNSFNIIGMQCQNQKCEERVENRYCFQCLLVYLIARREGQYWCTTEGHHQFKHCSMRNSSPIALCHFCSTAANEYYKDEACNINLCFKCSLILDSKGAIAL